MKKRFLLSAALTVSLLIVGTGSANALTPIEELGEFLYFDENLSDPSGQSCSSCHDPGFAFVDPDSEIPVSEGVIPDLFGGRNSPSAAYAMYAPIFHFDETEGLWIGGQFWDGRATGGVLGDPLADQALGPFLNPVEMANVSKTQVIKDVASSEYSDLFKQVWGKNSLKNVKKAYDQVALSIAAFERTELFAPFSSKYDAYLETCLANGGDKNDCSIGLGKVAKNTGNRVFTQKEWRGMQLFMGNNNNDGVLDEGEGAMCVACHVVDWTSATDLANSVVVPSWSPDGTIPPMFTDFTFDNLGAPQNTEFPLDPSAPADLGLGAIVSDSAENGKFKVMSLRNVGATGPYAHNGFFKTLKEITHFYNTRDVEMWPAPEVPDTMNTSELGSLGLNRQNERDIVAFMQTLTDGYKSK